MHLQATGCICSTGVADNVSKRLRPDGICMKTDGSAVRHTKRFCLLAMSQAGVSSGQKQLKPRSNPLYSQVSMPATLATDHDRHSRQSQLKCMPQAIAHKSGAPPPEPYRPQCTFPGALECPSIGHNAPPSPPPTRNVPSPPLAAYIYIYIQPLDGFKSSLPRTGSAGRHGSPAPGPHAGSRDGLVSKAVWWPAGGMAPVCAYPGRGVGWPGVALAGSPSLTADRPAPSPGSSPR